MAGVVNVPEALAAGVSDRPAFRGRAGEPGSLSSSGPGSFLLGSIWVPRAQIWGLETAENSHVLSITERIARSSFPQSFLATVLN